MSFPPKITYKYGWPNPCNHIFLNELKLYCTTPRRRVAHCCMSYCLLLVVDCPSYFVVGCLLAKVRCQGIGCWLSVIVVVDYCWLLTVMCKLSVVGCWLLIICCRCLWLCLVAALLFVDCRWRSLIFRFGFNFNLILIVGAQLGAFLSPIKGRYFDREEA